MLQRLSEDKLFWAAILAAPLFWLALFNLTSTTPTLTWPLQRPLLFAAIVVCYPILEEAAFRGLVQGFLLGHGFDKELLPAISQANLFTSILFTAMHFFYHPWQWAAAVIVPSLVYGYFRDKYASIKPCIILHIYYNLGYFLFFTPPSG